MPEQRITELCKLAINQASEELHFELKIVGGEIATFVAPLAIATQFADALGRAVSETRRRIPPAEDVVSSRVERQSREDPVTMHLTIRTGIPCSFALSPKMAVEIGETLQSKGKLWPARENG
jgi:hypothetical protein